MPVQKSRVTRSKRGMRRSHSALNLPTLSVDVSSGEIHRRHHIININGCYKGKQIIKKLKNENDK